MYKYVVVTIFLFNSYAVMSQNGSGKDSTAFLDSIFREMDEILDELVRPESFFTASMGAGTGFFNFKSTSSQTVSTEKKLLYSPGLAYFHKTGLGISLSAYAVNEQGQMNMYQMSVSGSYDYTKNKRWAAGTAYTRYITENNLSFYTSPVVNEMYGYFNYRKSWLQPGIALSYGWGSRTEYEERKRAIEAIRRLRNRGNITIRNEETVRDFSLLLSVRHDFDWSAVFFKSDLVTLTPVLLLSSGTQNFGFNTSFHSQSKIVNNFLPGNQFISDNTRFGPQSASAVLRADYSIGKLFLQSQFLLDYYLHIADTRFNNAFAVIAGINL